MVASYRTQVVFRTHRWTPVQEYLFGLIQEATRGEAVVVYDASHTPAQPYPKDVSFPIDLDWVRTRGFYPMKKWGWRAGDYSLYRASEVCGPYDHILMMDSDVMIHWPRFEGFLEELDRVSHDFLTLHIETQPGSRRRAMLSHPTLDFMAEKRSCMFGLVRASSALVSHAHALRLEYSAKYTEGILPFANDECLFSTIAASYPQYTISTFDAALHAPPRLFFRAKEPWALGELNLATLSRAIIHPVTSVDQS